MGHNPATRDGKKGDRKPIAETRTPDEILKAIRGNLAAHLAVTPNDVSFLLAQYDSAQNAVAVLGGATAGLLQRAENAEAKIADLQAKNDEFRAVYEQENRSTSILLSVEGTQQLVEELTTPGRIESDLHAADHGGEA